MEIISVSTNYWSYINSNEGNFNYGLFEFCGEANSISACIDTNEGDIKTAVSYARFLSMFGIAGLLFALVYHPVIGLSIAVLCNIAVITIFFTKITNNFKYEQASGETKIGYSSILFFLSTAINAFLLGKLLLY